MKQDEAAELEVGAVSRCTGVTVRTLHHYDQIGLLTPSSRSRAGYRLYSQADLERLRRILFYRELGFGLDQIGALLDRGTDPVAELGRQRELVAERIQRLEQIASAIDAELAAVGMGIPLTPKEKFEMFGDDWSDEHAVEAEQRWGHTEAWQQSQQRASQYTPDQWREIKAASAEIERAFARLVAAGLDPQLEAARNLAEAHRQHIITWFYDVPYGLHRGLAEMYIADPRFVAYYDKIAPGLAQFVRDAIVANADAETSGQ